MIAYQDYRGFSYEPPYVETLENVHPTPEMKGLLQEHMKFDLIIYESWRPKKILQNVTLMKRIQEEDKGGEGLLER